MTRRKKPILPAVGEADQPPPCGAVALDDVVGLDVGGQTGRAEVRHGQSPDVSCAAARDG